MSLINPKNGWIQFDGTPVQGITPPQVRLRSGTLTPERLAAVSDLHAKFTTAKRLSLAGSGFFTADRRLPDGTIVRMVAINDVDHVHIWAADAAQEEVEGITFWCIPWDDEWIDEAFAEVFTIPRWLEIGTADNEVEAADFLQDLTRNEKYEPPSAGLYPGNQTWFAMPPHQSAGIVVSWWGKMRRYRVSDMAESIDTSTAWGGRDTGGIAGALAGRMFMMPGAPEFTDPDPTRTQLDDRAYVWVNGVAYSAGAPVESACMGYRDGARVLRTVGPMNSSGIVTVRELHGDGFGEITSLASLDLRPAVLGASLGPPQIINGTPYGATWTPTAWPIQPFYWNSDGTEAIGIIGYQGFYGTFSTEWFRQTNVVVKIAVSGGGCVAEIIDTTHYESTYTTGSGNSAFSLEYSKPIAADFRGDEAVIVRSHIDTTRAGSRAGDLTNHTGSATETVNTRVSVNNATIAGTAESKTSTTSEAASAGGAYPTNWSDSEIHHTSSGRVSTWAVLAGDLRGVFLLHAAPLRVTHLGSSETSAGYLTTTLDTASHREGYSEFDSGEETSSVDLTRTYAIGQGELLLCWPDGDTETVANLSVPLEAAVMGALSVVDGVVTSSTNPHGSGLGPAHGEPPLWGVSVTGVFGSGISSHTLSAVDFVDELRYWSDVVLTGSAITPDGKTQYLGAVLIAMTEPSDPLATAQAFVVDKWFHEGNEFTPLYPPQTDPGNPDDTMPFPHRGGHAILLDPIFTGPLP